MEEHTQDCLKLTHGVVKVCLGVEALFEDGEEVVDASSVFLGGDGADADGLFIDHLHDLPLLPVLAWTPVLASAEAVGLLIVVFVRQRSFEHQGVRRMQGTLHTLLEALLDSGQLLLRHDALKSVQDLRHVDAVAVTHKLLRISGNVLSCVGVVVTAKKVILECSVVSTTCATVTMLFL